MYNREWLRNAYVRRQAREALAEGCINLEAYAGICQAHAVGFYTPNYFVRIGLGVAALLIIWFGGAIISVGFMSFRAMLAVNTVACYVMAEVVARQKHHYNSGVDNMLLWHAALGFWLFFSWGYIDDFGRFMAVPALIGFIVCVALVIRSADRLLSVAGAVALLAFVLLGLDGSGGPWGGLPSAVALAATSGVLFTGAAYGSTLPALWPYHTCLQWVSVVALTGFYGAGILPQYVAGNYETTPHWIAFVWLFAMPVAYIIAGAATRSILLIRTGLPLIAVSIFLFRQYHHVLAAEVAMLIGGVVLCVVCYGLMKWLAQPHGGFVFRPERPDAGQEPETDKLVTDAVIGRMMRR